MRYTRSNKNKRVHEGLNTILCLWELQFVLILTDVGSSEGSSFS